jgi:hypothetical protein
MPPTELPCVQVSAKQVGTAVATLMVVDIGSRYFEKEPQKWERLRT